MRLTITLVVAASLAACGSQNGNSAAPAEDPAVTLELPPEPPPAPQPDPAPVPAPGPSKQAPPETPEAPETPQSASKKPPPASTSEEPPVPDEPPPAPSPAEEPAAPGARLPLGDSQIARTIDRIGYRCGSVVSATAADRNSEGQAVYRIACSSGETYRGTNRGGRMFFRPWEGRTGGR